MWSRVTCLLAFHRDHSDSTFHYPIEALYKEPFGYIEKGEELKSKKTIVNCCQSLYLSLHPFVPWSTLCSYQACLFLVRFLSRDGGLKWWRPKWGTQFLRFADMPTEVVTLVISIFILIEISFPFQ